MPVLSRVPGKSIKERIWFALLNPVDQKMIGRDFYWKGKVKTNKDVTINFDSEVGRIFRHFKKGKARACNYIELTQLIQIEIQEGPEEALKKFGAMGRPRYPSKKSDPNLVVEIVEDDEDEQIADMQVAQGRGIPDLDTGEPDIEE